MTQVHRGINIGLQQIRNTSEYILKLQLHQHSLLTRKVFSRHNFHHWSSSLDHLIICIFKSSSSSSHLHLWIQIITGYHHWIWIITGSRSSLLDVDHHSIWIVSRASSLDLDHPSIWIITAGSSSLDHHGCYLMILLVIGSSIEPALFHAGCRPSLHVGFLPALISTLSQNGLPNTYI